ncbi:hypothetical protein T484DRAFT_1757608, partial [Baffinella frigidus]
MLVWENQLARMKNNGNAFNSYTINNLIELDDLIQTREREKLVSIPYVSSSYDDYKIDKTTSSSVWGILFQKVLCNRAKGAPRSASMSAFPIVCDTFTGPLETTHRRRMFELVTGEITKNHNIYNDVFKPCLRDAAGTDDWLRRLQSRISREEVEFLPCGSLSEDMPVSCQCIPGSWNRLKDYDPTTPWRNCHIFESPMFNLHFTEILHIKDPMPAYTRILRLYESGKSPVNNKIQFNHTEHKGDVNRSYNYSAVAYHVLEDDLHLFHKIHDIAMRIQASVSLSSGMEEEKYNTLVRTLYELFPVENTTARLNARTGITDAIEMVPTLPSVATVGTPVKMDKPDPNVKYFRFLFNHKDSRVGGFFFVLVQMNWTNTRSLNFTELVHDVTTRLGIGNPVVNDPSVGTPSVANGTRSPELSMTKRTSDTRSVKSPETNDGSSDSDWDGNTSTRSNTDKSTTTNPHYDVFVRPSVEGSRTKHQPMEREGGHTHNAHKYIPPIVD